MWNPFKKQKEEKYTKHVNTEKVINPTSDRFDNTFKERDGLYSKIRDILKNTTDVQTIGFKESVYASRPIKKGNIMIYSIKSSKGKKEIIILNYDSSQRKITFWQDGSLTKKGFQRFKNLMINASRKLGIRAFE